MPAALGILSRPKQVFAWWLFPIQQQVYFFAGMSVAGAASEFQAHGHQQKIRLLSADSPAPKGKQFDVNRDRRMLWFISLRSVHSSQPA